MDTGNRYPHRVPKQRWAPPNDEVNAEIEAMVELHRRQQELDAEYRQALAKLADPEGRAVPIAHLAERLGMERKTVYRHLGRSMT